MTIGELLKELEDFKDNIDYRVGFRFAQCKPTTFTSYRGDYSELALEFSGDYGTPYPTTKELYEDLQECLYFPFTGWKGGEYYMYEDTLIHIGCEGISSNTILSGITIKHYSDMKSGWITLETEEENK